MTEHVSTVVEITEATRRFLAEKVMGWKISGISGIPLSTVQFHSVASGVYMSEVWEQIDKAKDMGSSLLFNKGTEEG